MQNRLKAYLPALFCALTPLLCYLIIRPYAEIGINDDWSYIRTTQLLAETGHIVYTGWVNPILGWQLYLGALFIKLFGFSFTTVRLSTLAEAAATAFLLQRTLLRAGINQWNATLATLTFLLSPSFVEFSVTFYTDVSGVLCIVLCLYLCLRALQAQSPNSAMVLIVLAALSNAVGGTARQIAWLGVLVMVPSALWLVRRERRVLVAGALACVAGAGFVFAAMRWFAQQPYTIVEPLLYRKIDFQSMQNLGFAALVGTGLLALFLVPVLVMVKEPQGRMTGRRAVIFAACCRVCVLLGVMFNLLAKVIHSPISFLGVHLTFLQPQSAILVPVSALWLLAMGMTGLVLLSAATYSSGAADSVEGNTTSVSWHQLGVLLGPFSCAYVLLLVPRAFAGVIYDRYLLPVMVVGLLVLTLYYQQKVKRYLPFASILLIGLAGSLSVVATHNEFALYRAYLAAIHEIRSSGVPADAILGPWEYDSWVEAERVGHVNVEANVPRNAYVQPPPGRVPASCYSDFSETLDLTPGLKPAYIVSKDPIECGAPAGFPPVAYHKWLVRQPSPIYMTKLPVSFNH